MVHDFPDATLTEPPDERLLDDLEVRCATNVAAVRGTAVLSTPVTVEVRAADIVARGAVLAELSTTEVSSQSVTGIAVRPLMVGSVFHLRFPDGDFAARATLAICDRCAMLGDASFELHLRFVQALARPGERGSHGT